MTAQIDMDAVVAQTVQQLGAELAMVRLELNAQRAANKALQEQQDEQPEEGES